MKSEIQAAISKGASLLKYAYLGGGSAAWDKLRGAESFAVGGREINALRAIAEKGAREFRASGKPLRLIHVGSGNGIEIPLFLDMFALGKKDAYVAVDVSPELLELVKKRQGAELSAKVGEVSYTQADAEAPGQLAISLRKSNDRITVLAASGEGTLLSNFAVLENLKQCIETEGYLMLSLDGIAPDRIESVCKEYDQAVVRDFLIHSVRYALSTGAIRNGEGQFLPATYDQNLSQLIVRYRLNDGPELVLLRSWKPTSQEAIAKTLQSNGLKALQIEAVDGAYGILATAPSSPAEGAVTFGR